MGSRVVRMMEVNRMYQAPSHHVGPESIGNIAIERGIVTIGRLKCQLFPATVVGNRAYIFFRFDLI